MSELVNISVSRRPVPGFLARARQALRSYWTGPFTLKDPALNQLFGISARSLAGPLVNDHTIFTCAAVFDAVNQIASDVAKLPLHLKKRRQDRGTDDYIDSKVYRLMKYSPNPETRSMVFRRTLTTHALIAKGGFAEIERDAVGRPVALWIIEPHRVKPFYDMERPSADGRRNPLRYLIDGKDIFEANEILHLQGPGWDGVVGFEMVQVAREAIGLALASQQFASAFFGNQARFGGILMATDRDLDPDQEKELRDRIEAMHVRADKAFRLLVLGAGFQYHETGVKPNDAQMKEIRDQQVEEVARFFNMPLHKLKLSRPGAVSYASVEMADLDYYKGCLLNWITLWEQELDAKLVPALELGHQYFKHNVNAFLRGTIKERYDALGIARDKGIINADEWRDLEDMNPQPDGQGKVYLVQQAMIPADQLTELVQSQIEKNRATAKRLEPPPVKPPPSEPSPAPSDDDRAALHRRLEEAERLVTQAREAEAAAVTRLQVVEQDEGMTQAELTRLRDQATAATALREQFQVIAEYVQTKSDALQLRQTQLAEDLARETAAKEEAERARAEAEQAAERARHDAAQAIDAARAEAQGALRDRDAKVAEAERASAAAHEAASAEASAAAALRETIERADTATTLRIAAEQALAEALDQAQATAASSEFADTARAEAVATAAAATERAEQLLSASVEQLAALGAARTQAQAALDAAEAGRREAEAAHEHAMQAATAAGARALRAEQAEADLRTKAETEHEAAAQAVAALQTRLATLEAGHDDLQTVRATLEARVTEEAASRAAAEAALAQAQAAGQAEAETRAAAESRVREAVAAHDALLATRAALETRLAEESGQRAAAEAALEVQRQQERERLLAVIAAHRGLIVDAMGRMTRREAQQARSKSTPEKLRRWLRSFPTLHEALCIEALLPSIRVYLAWKGSAEDPVAVTTGRVREHIQALAEQVTGVLDGDPEAFQLLLDRVLTRWETDRPNAVADAILLEEIRHVQAR